MTIARTIEDIIACLTHVSRVQDLAGRDAFPEFDAELVRPIIEEAGKFASEILAPINQSGDVEGARLVDGDVISAKGFREAYAAFQESGWMSLSAPEIYGGQGLPRTLAMAVMELLQGANMSFALCPMLSFGAIDALLEHGTDQQKADYLPKLISGEWTGTMNLTEPQAGSDVGALKTKAEPSGDGSYVLTGQKTYITWGDHDLTSNIIHLVLARLPDAPAGSRGISLFLCPKYLLDQSGEPGKRNRVSCSGLEHKLGIHASPTCVMQFDGAKAFMIGEPNKGLAAMFTMMNSARLHVGVQGVSQAESAFQTARLFASERTQGRRVGIEGPAPIITHPDVQNMLLKMRACTMAARAICYACAKANDEAVSAADNTSRVEASWREDILTPIAKAWSTDIGVEMASLGIQVHGGMGFMSEALASQIYRDVRIAPIYEGTNGIQAMDLLSRKLPMADGQAIKSILAEFSRIAKATTHNSDDRSQQIANNLEDALSALQKATDWLMDHNRDAADTTLFGATAYLNLLARVAGVGLLANGALTASEDDPDFSNELVDIAFILSQLDLTGIAGLVSRIKLGRDISWDRRMELLY